MNKMSLESGVAASTIENSVLLLADISGYSSFLQAVQEAHPEMT